MAEHRMKPEAAPASLEREDVQGLLVRAYGHLPWSAHVLLRIGDAVRARRWLAEVAAEITPAAGKERRRAVNLAVTYSGLVGLGYDASAFPIAFVDGMASQRRATILGDTGASAPARWEWGTGASGVDLALLLFAPTSAALETSLDERAGAYAAAGLVPIVTLRAQRFADGKEHFGFADGIAQPGRPAHTEPPHRLFRRAPAANEVPLGEFILGYPNAYGVAARYPGLAGMPDFGRNGSFLVLRQLAQDVAKFWRFLDAATSGDPAARERLAAKLIGRWPSGAPLAKSPDADDPRLAKNNDFGYAADPHGHRCPIGAHIRRANPRDGFAGDSPAQSLRRSNRHRILRRGRSYGPRLENVLVDDGQARGLHFLCLNADIERQFEFVQQTWLNNPNFCGLANEVDPLVGAPLGGGVMTIPRRPLRRRLAGLEQFVTTKGGAYFFLPGLRALRFLATPR